MAEEHYEVTVYRRGEWHAVQHPTLRTYRSAVFVAQQEGWRGAPVRIIRVTPEGRAAAEERET